MVTVPPWRLPGYDGVGAATAHRYVTEIVELLAELAPELRQALRIAGRKADVILNGPLVATDRLPGSCTTRAKHRPGA